ncbi:MAG TPA: Ku protein [Gammaproteobacteria bacterium]
MPEDRDDEERVRPRPFWSGVIAFGLVSLPVSLFPANRSRRVSLKMVDDSGTPLSRRYFCEHEQKALSADDIVRGYKAGEHHYVVVEDKELEDLAPEKSQEIDLKRFVPLDDIDPIWFERAYFLVPDEGATKAYRLLAKSMEDERRAGIATFVMRGKEYLVAIMAERGILRAETLPFHDEVRTPEDVGLPALKKAAKEQVARMQKAMKALAAKELDRDELNDRHTRLVLETVQKKIKAGKDVVKAPEEEAAEAEEDNVIDLMQVLKERLQGGTPAEPKPAKREESRGRREEKSRRHPVGASAKPLEDSTKEELYELAKELHIPGRSGMSKRQLVDAIRERR